MTFNEWLLSLSEGRRSVLIEDKWMLAQAAYEAGKPDPENPKKGDVFRMEDDNHPIVVDYMDNLFCLDLVRWT